METPAEVQEAYKQLLQQASAQFQETVNQATANIQKMMEEAEKKYAKPEPVPLEAKIIDGGLWLNEPATNALIEIMEAMQNLLVEMEKG